jgi:hypothetical protein
MYGHADECVTRTPVRHAMVAVKFKIGDRVCNHATDECVKGEVVGYEVRYIVKQDGMPVPCWARRAEKLKLESLDPLVEAQKEITRLQQRIAKLESDQTRARVFGGDIP